MTRKLKYQVIADAVAELCRKANYELPGDQLRALERAIEEEHSPLGGATLRSILQNAAIASQGEYPICQDCGVATFFVDMGSEVLVKGMTLEEALNAGVKRGYAEHYLRKSIVRDPCSRENTGDNTPPVIHTRLVDGDGIRIRFMPKGSGSENMSACKMMTPADGVEGIKRMILTCVENAGAKPCPPIAVGIGIGGTFDRCPELAKLALFREVGSKHSEPFYENLERELLEDINRLGIGPLGLGGTVTALAVHIQAAPCHIASLPVAVNLQCHAARRAEVVL